MAWWGFSFSWILVFTTVISVVGLDAGLSSWVEKERRNAVLVPVEAGLLLGGGSECLQLSCR